MGPLGPPGGRRPTYGRPPWALWGPKGPMRGGAPLWALWGPKGPKRARGAPPEERPLRPPKRRGRGEAAGGRKSRFSEIVGDRLPGIPGGPWPPRGGPGGTPPSPFMPYSSRVHLLGMTCPIDDTHCGSAEDMLPLYVYTRLTLVRMRYTHGMRNGQFTPVHWKANGQQCPKEAGAQRGSRLQA